MSTCHSCGEEIKPSELSETIGKEIFCCRCADEAWGSRFNNSGDSLTSAAVLESESASAAKSAGLKSISDRGKKEWDIEAFGASSAEYLKMVKSATSTRHCPDCWRLWESLYTVPVLPGTVPEQPCPNCYRIEMEDQE